MPIKQCAVCACKYSTNHGNMLKKTNMKRLSLLSIIPLFMLLGMTGCATSPRKQEEASIHLKIGIAHIKSRQY